MTQFRTVLLSSGLLLALCGGVAQAEPNKPIQTLQMPAMPDPARITLNPKTTALMMLDYVEDICATQPNCKSQMLPAVTPFMERVTQGRSRRGIWHPRTEHDPLAAAGRAG